MRTMHTSLLLLLLTAPANASALFSFDQSTYSVTAGGTVAVPVYLQLEGADFTKLQAGTGLLSAGLDMFRASGSAGIAGPADVAPNTTDFNEIIAGVSPKVTWNSPGDALLFENVDIATATAGVMGTITGSSARIYLGSFTFTAPGFADSTTFLARPYPTSAIVTFGSGPNLTDNIYTLDPATSASITINMAVPLPAAAWAGSSLLAALGGLAGLRRRRRRSPAD